MANIPIAYLMKSWGSLVLLIVTHSAFADICPTLETRPLCFETMLSKDQNFSNQLQKQIFNTQDTCRLGPSKKFNASLQIEIEASRLAPILQKLELLKQSDGKSESVKKIEKLFKDSSIIMMSSSAQQNFEKLTDAPVWNPNDLNIKTQSLIRDLNFEAQSKNWASKMNASMNQMALMASSCSASNPKLAFLKSSAQQDSFRVHQFKRALSDTFSAEQISRAFQSCAPPVKKQNPCSTKPEVQKSIAEAETNLKICVTRKLFPDVGAELSDINMSLPSAYGDLITNSLSDAPTEAEAKSKKFKFNFICPEDVSLGGLARGAAGAGASFLTHELSHQGVASLLGEKMTWNLKNGTWTCHNCDKNIKPIALAGLVSHNISSEYLVRNQDNDSQFQKGWLLFNIGNTITYFGKDWLARAGKIKGSSYASGTVDHKGAGDLRAFSNKQSYLLGAAMIGHQLFTGYRYLKNRQDYDCKTEWRK